MVVLLKTNDELNKCVCCSTARSSDGFTVSNAQTSSSSTIQDLATLWTLGAFGGSGQVIELQYGWLKLLLAACDNRRRFGRVALDASECVFPCRRKVHALSSSDRLSAVHPILSLSLYTVSTLLLSFPLLLFLCLSLFLSASSSLPVSLANVLTSHRATGHASGDS